jgi:hypothetical protein
VDLVGIHSVVGWTLVVANGAVGLWALAAQWFEPLRARVLWWAVAGAQSLLFVQAGIGVVLYSGLAGEAPRIHMFYGFLTLVAVAVLYGYRVPLGDRRYVLYGLGSLFIMGLGLQSMANYHELSHHELSHHGPSLYVHGYVEGVHELVAMAITMGWGPLQVLTG